MINNSSMLIHCKIGKLTFENVEQINKVLFQRHINITEVYLKEDIIKLLKVLILNEGNEDITYIPKVNDEIVLNLIIHKKRKNEMKKEKERTVTLKIGDATVFKCYNLISSILVKGERVKFICPSELNNINVSGRSPNINVEIELKVIDIMHAWTEEEIRKVFKIQIVNLGNKNIFPTVNGDEILLHYKIYNPINLQVVEDSRTENKPMIYILGQKNENIIDCYNIVIPVLYLNEKVKVFCPQKYIQSENKNNKEIYKLNLNSDSELVVELEIIAINKLKENEIPNQVIKNEL